MQIMKIKKNKKIHEIHEKACLAKPFEIKLGLELNFQGHHFCNKNNIGKN